MSSKVEQRDLAPIADRLDPVRVNNLRPDLISGKDSLRPVRVRSVSLHSRALWKTVVV
jgi:hypothetical protein